MDQTLGPNRQTPSAPACEGVNESTASTQRQLQSGDVGDQPPVACPRCNKTSNKKRRIKCSRCSQEWQLSCVRLTRAQAEVPTCWWCAKCLSSTGVQPPLPTEAAGADESMPESTRPWETAISGHAGSRQRRACSQTSTPQTDAPGNRQNPKGSQKSSRSCVGSSD